MCFAAVHAHDCNKNGGNSEILYAACLAVDGPEENCGEEDRKHAHHHPDFFYLSSCVSPHTPCHDTALEGMISLERICIYARNASLHQSIPQLKCRRCFCHWPCTMQVEAICRQKLSDTLHTCTFLSCMYVLSCLVCMHFPAAQASSCLPWHACTLLPSMHAVECCPCKCL